MTLERVDINQCEDQLQIVLHRARYDFVLARLAPAQRVLEIGTGAGTFTKELFAKSGSFTGVEFDEKACLETRRKTDNRAEIIQGDARCLPFKDNQFSFIICLEVLEHLGDFKAGIREIHRCLRSDGIGIISIPYRRIGKAEANEFHLYEPGAKELVSSFKKLFSKVEVHYQYLEETYLMTLLRTLHLRRLFGAGQIYADLSAGLPSATEKLRIGRQSRGMRTHLILVISGKN
jgi:ubiquinone/menaquinone biosynthesis C-methylase UbiE